MAGEVLYTAEDHDLAFMRVPFNGTSANHASDLSRRRCHPGLPICAIGFPAENTKFYDPGHIDPIFRGIFDAKRVAPGEILCVSDQRIDHDCTTLGGNSGSPLVDLDSGQVVGLHTDRDPVLARPCRASQRDPRASGPDPTVATASRHPWGANCPRRRAAHWSRSRIEPSSTGPCARAAIVASSCFLAFRSRLLAVFSGTPRN